MRYGLIVVIAGMLALFVGCNEPDPQTVELDQRLVTVYNDAAVENAIIRQHTLYPYHFEYGGADINALGKKDLAILADHFVEYPGALNVRRGEEPAAVYEARIVAVRQFLVDAGVDGRRVSIGDDLPGGEGLTSQETAIIIMESHGPTEAFERTSISLPGN